MILAPSVLSEPARRTASRRGFTAVELLALIVITALVFAVLCIASDGSRRLGRLGEDIAHLKQFGVATGEYAADNGDRFWTFSWVHGQVYQTLFPDLNFAGDDLQAAANQAVYILRTRGQRPTMPVINGWIPHLLYSHLALVDYLDRRLPSLAVVSAADIHRRKWAMDPACFDQGCFSPYQPSPGGANVRWPYSASFSPGVAFFDASPVGFRISQVGNAYNLYTTGGINTILRGLPLTTVAHPAQKVLMSDQNARHFGTRQPYCTHDQARLPLLMVDASVDVRAAAGANPGWNPNNPSSPSPTSLIYSPNGAPWDPPAVSPSGDIVTGRFRWTRGGLLGRDFGGPETQ